MSDIDEILHVWVGTPQSPSELSQLLRKVEDAYAASDDTRVVFENKVMPISELATGVRGDKSVREDIVARASSLQIHTATALILVQIGAVVPVPHSIDSLTYLGSFQIRRG